MLICPALTVVSAGFLLRRELCCKINAPADAVGTLLAIDREEAAKTLCLSVEFDSSGAFIQAIGSYGSGRLNYPNDVALDSSVNLYTLRGGNNNRIMKFRNTSTAPQPGSVALLVGMASVGVGLLRRRRKG